MIILFIEFKYEIPKSATYLDATRLVNSVDPLIHTVPVKIKNVNPNLSITRQFEKYYS